jgi:hypothetical protein
MTIICTIWLPEKSVKGSIPISLSNFTLNLLPTDSPHWLVSKGRVDEAQMTLRSLRSYDVEDELRGIIAAFTLTKGAKTKPLDCFRGLNLKRTLIVMGLQILNLAQGTWNAGPPKHLRHRQTHFTTFGTGLNFLLGYMVILFIQIGLPDPFKIIVIGDCFIITIVQCIER